MLVACCSLVYHVASSPLLNWTVLDDPAAWCHQLAALVSNDPPSTETWSTLQNLVAGNPQHSPNQRVDAWMSRKCAVGTWHKYIDAAPLPQCRGQGNRNVVCTLRTKLATIAVLVGSTSRGVAHPSADTMSLFQVNPLKKPGPVFNAVARRAYADGADIFYRINDDTFMATPWAGHLVDALCQRLYPHGVAGTVKASTKTF